MVTSSASKVLCPMTLHNTQLSITDHLRGGAITKTSDMDVTIGCYQGDYSSLDMGLLNITPWKRRDVTLNGLVVIRE